MQSEMERRKREEESRAAASTAAPAAVPARQAPAAGRSAKSSGPVHPCPPLSDLVSVVAHHYGVSLDVADRWFLELSKERAA